MTNSSEGGMPDDRIISEMCMAYIEGVHWPEAIRNFGVEAREVRGMQNVLALLVSKGYRRADLASAQPVTVQHEAVAFSVTDGDTNTLFHLKEDAERLKKLYPSSVVTPLYGAPQNLGGAAQRVWPDVIAPPQYENAAAGWSDPELPDFKTIWAIARTNGYAVGIHGSLKRDVDLIAAPWVDEHSTPEALVSALCDGLNASQIGGPTIKPCGRVAFSLNIDGWFKPIDISIMPSSTLRALPAEAPPTGIDAEGLRNAFIELYEYARDCEILFSDKFVALYLALQSIQPLSALTDPAPVVKNPAENEQKDRGHE